VPAERTVGVEEEFLLLDATEARLAPAGDAVVAAAEGLDAAGQFEHELKRSQAEIGSRPAERLSELADDLRALRAALSTAAAERGVRVVASGTSAVPGRSGTTDDERYRAMAEQFGIVARQQLTCGMHVHVSIGSPDEGVGVLDRIRPWLSVLVALSANSPLHSGAVTGYASYRTILWSQWPTAGPTATFGSVATYEQVRGDLVTLGAAQDDGMIYFDARLSAHYPTLEIRVCDVCADADDAVTIAGLTRALVSTEADRWQAGEPAPPLRPELLRAASWRAARWGLTGELADLRGAGGQVGLLPASNLIKGLLEHVGPALEAAGDLDRVIAGLAEIEARGTGSARQRRAYDSGGVPAALDAVTVPAVPVST
jgi:glutamate---cysteine ligase / carboxylate-amine ligase